MTTKMVLDFNGNLGIGTVRPGTGISTALTTALHVGPGSGTNPGIVLEDNVNSYKHLLRIIDNAFWIVADNGTTARIDLAVDSTSGNVGIGTTDPGSYKLAVEGKIGAREVVVTLDSWADFVFEKDYRLMPLHEVEQHIQENQRLPDIPSEKEVLENGVSLGEMQSKLLQKVEELTLYVIEQNKRIEKLEKENGALKDRVASLEETK